MCNNVRTLIFISCISTPVSYLECVYFLLSEFITQSYPFLILVRMLISEISKTYLYFCQLMNEGTNSKKKHVHCFIFLLRMRIVISVNLYVRTSKNNIFIVCIFTQNAYSNFSKCVIMLEL